MNILLNALLAASLAGQAAAQVPSPPQRAPRLADPQLSHSTVFTLTSPRVREVASQDWRLSNRRVQELSGHRGHLNAGANRPIAPAAPASAPAPGMGARP